MPFLKTIRGEKAAKIRTPAVVLVIALIAAAIFITTENAAQERVKIGDIIRDPWHYAGRVITLECKYGGWIYGGDIPVTDQGPPVTRSDWAVYDETGGIYVQANGGAEVLKSSYPGRLIPTNENCIGADIVIRGIVRISDRGVPYIG
jgi:hypothetical protein